MSKMLCLLKFQIYTSVSSGTIFFWLLNFAFLIWHTQILEVFSLHTAVCNTPSAHEQYMPWWIISYSIMTCILPYTTIVTYYCKLHLHLFLELCSILISEILLAIGCVCHHSIVIIKINRPRPPSKIKFWSERYIWSFGDLSSDADRETSERM